MHNADNAIFIPLPKHKKHKIKEAWASMGEKGNTYRVGGKT